jgi:hypothetical protein
MNNTRVYNQYLNGLGPFDFAIVFPREVEITKIVMNWPQGSHDEDSIAFFINEDVSFENGVPIGPSSSATDFENIQLTPARSDNSNQIMVFDNINWKGRRFRFTGAWESYSLGYPAYLNVFWRFTV